MLAYDELFQLFQAGDRDALLVALFPWLRRWARDVLRDTRHEGNYSYQEELFSAGSEHLDTEINKRIQAGNIESGKHLIRSLRIAIRQQMKRARRDLSVVPVTLPETIKARRERGEEPVLPYHPRKREPMLGTYRHARKSTDRLEKSTDEAYFASDPKKSYWYFVTRTCEAACQIADERGWDFVGKMYAADLNQTEAAKLLGIPRTTIGYRLRQLRYEIVDRATAELDELGRQFLRAEWITSAEAEILKQNNGNSSAVRPAKRRKSSTVLRQDSAGIASARQRNEEESAFKGMAADARDKKHNRQNVENRDNRNRRAGGWKTRQERPSEKLRIDPAENPSACQRTLRRAPSDSAGTTIGKISD